MMRSTLIASLVLLAGCAPTAWQRADATAQDISQDSARCRLIARGIAPTGFYAQGSPGFVGGAAIGHGIGALITQDQNYSDCMMAIGYTPALPR